MTRRQKVNLPENDFRHDKKFPDGGWGWMIVVAYGCANVSIDSWPRSMLRGVFESQSIQCIPRFLKYPTIFQFFTTTDNFLSNLCL
jgi:hypothetical protein